MERRGGLLISVWNEPPKMDAGAPHPDTQLLGDSLLVAYRTSRGDHFAVVRFSGVSDWSLGGRDDETLDKHWLWNHGLQLYAFHEIHDPQLSNRGLRRWVVAFHDDTLDVTASDAAVLLRAIQAQDARSALAMVQP
jgi:hypothetical protein